MTASTWVNNGSGNGLLYDSTKQLPEPMFTYHQSPVGIKQRKILQKLFKILPTTKCLKILFDNYVWKYWFIS